MVKLRDSSQSELNPQKDNPGTLPISAYGRRVLTANPSPCLVELRNSLASQGSSSSESDSADTTEHCGSIIPEFIGKGSTLLVSHDQRASGMFLLGVLAHDWRPKKKTALLVMQQKCIYTLQIKRTVCYFTMSSLAGSN